jgi:c-di-GMP-binding flagellar brake protein YcgR
MHGGYRGQRRQLDRIASLGVAYVMLDDETAVSYRVENLSVGGAALSQGPPLPWCETLRVVLKVTPIPPVEIDARIAWRTEGEAPRYGIEFVSVDAAVADAIQAAVDAILTGHRLLAELPVRRARLASWLP